MKAADLPFLRFLIVSAVAGTGIASAAEQSTPAGGATVSGSSDPVAISDEEFRIPVSESTRAQVAELIQKLNSPKHADREDGTNVLLEFGAEAFLQLRETYRTCTDYEVRTRIAAIVQKSYFEHHIYRRYGYLGVALGDVIESDDENDIPAGRSAITVGLVKVSTGAHRAGMLAGDQIIAVNGLPIQGVGKAATDAFRLMIFDAGPGTPLELTVLRKPKPDTKPETLILKPVLTRMPRVGTTDARQVQALQKPADEALSRFPTWWLKHFGSSDAGLTEPKADRGGGSESP